MIKLPDLRPVCLCSVPDSIQEVTSVHCKIVSWFFFHILTEPVPCTFVSVDRRNMKSGPALHIIVHYSVDLRIQTYMEPVPLKYRKLATKYQCLWTFYSIVDH